jgi:hypothetical protein
LCKSQLEKGFDGAGKEPPALYYAGWLPNVSPEDVARLPARVAPDRVWLSDMLGRNEFLARLPLMKNVTRGGVAERASLEVFCRVFGATSGLTRSHAPRPAPFASVGHLIDRKNARLKKLTREQEELAFSPLLVRGPKVIRGVAGSGKTVVLANAVAETLLRAMSRRSQPDLFAPQSGHRLPRILVLCYNRTLAPYLERTIKQCFEARKPDTAWVFPASTLLVRNVDRFAVPQRQVTCPPSPCGRLSRPRTTTGTPWP